VLALLDDVAAEVQVSLHNSIYWRRYWQHCSGVLCANPD
jgi:hypothetical protein